MNGKIDLSKVDLRETYLTEIEAAKMTGIAMSTLQKHRMRNEGIPYIRFWRTIRYKRSDIVRFMEEHRIETAGVAR